MTTYTILSNDGEVLDRGLSLADAAHEVLISDSRQYEIRQDGGIWTIWSRQPVANRGWEPTVVCSAQQDRAEAEKEMFQEVVSSDWPGHNEAVTDEQYEKILAALAEEDE